MQLTDYHAKYFAHELTKRCSSDSVEKLAGALVDAQVDLNPHQVEAALFAFRSPLSRGALLADEVGLGKTIEAGLVVSQKWAERKRRILIITPSNLRKQWHQELQEKFFLPCQILETRSYNEALKRGHLRPFEVQDAIPICSYQFARNKAADVHGTRWDLVVIDEAHRLRNVYKPSNVIANTLKQALKDAPKLLLTATPLQNSLLELFGLVSFIDEHAFGDLKSFREQFTYLNDDRVFDTLKARLKPICHRTLRRQVTAYVSYTRRHPLVQPFTPEEGEDRLYHLVSEYLRRDNLQALPSRQRSLMTLVLRKLLASSTFAIAGALNTLSQRLQARLKKHQPAPLEEERLLMQLTEYELNGHAEFLDGQSAFRLKSCPFPDSNGDIPLGLYELPRRSGEAHLYRLGHPLAVRVLQQARSRALSPAEITFDYSGHDSRISVLEPHIGKSGELLLGLFTVESLDQAEDYLLFAAATESGHVLEEDAARRLLSLPASSAKPLAGVSPNGRLQELVERQKTAIQRSISERNARFFEAEAEKLDSWADDLKVALEREIKDMDRQIKETRRAATLTLTLEEKLAGQKQIKALESQRNSKRRTLFDAQDEIDRWREQLIEDIEGKMTVKTGCQTIFHLRWRLA